MIRSLYNTDEEVGHISCYQITQPGVISNTMDDSLKGYMVMKSLSFCKLVGLSGILMAQHMATLLNMSPILEYQNLSHE